MMWRHKPSGLIWAVLWLLCLEGWIRAGSVWRAFPDSQVGAYLAVEDHFRTQPRLPRVIFLGSSRMRDAIAPRIVEHALGLPTGAVANLAVTSGTAFDALRMYDRNPDRFAGAAVAVIGIEDWWFNATRSFESMNRVRFAAGLSERLRYPGLAAKSDLVLGGFWRTWDARYVLRAYIDTFSIPPQGALRPADAAPLDDWGRIGARQNETGVTQAADVERAAQEYMGDFRLDGFSLWALERLVAKLKDGGMDVVVIRLPLRPEYRALASGRYAGPEVLWHAAVRAAIGNDVFEPEAAALGIVKGDFVDYGHLARPGAAKLSRALAGWLRMHVRTAP
jgi:hypothetical protein